MVTSSILPSNRKSMFFFERRTKKLLLLYTRWPASPRQQAKVFCFFFSKKKILAYVRSDQFQVRRSRLAALHRHFVADSLAVIKAAQTGRLDGRDMDKHVLPTITRHDEPKTLGCVKPFYSAGSHFAVALRVAAPRWD
jgi:hypothetical protein